MAAFVSAGHHLKDSGAVAHGRQENLEMIKFRDSVVNFCKSLGVKVITDSDNETLSQYLLRIQSGSGSVVVEFHLDAAENESATGMTSVVGDDADRLDKMFAKEMVDTGSAILGIKNRGVITESKTHRGKLGLMREQGIVALVELGFITNKNDMAALDANTFTLASAFAKIIKKYDDMIQ